MCHFKIHKKEKQAFDCTDITNNSIRIRNQSTCRTWQTLEILCPRFFVPLIINTVSIAHRSFWWHLVPTKLRNVEIWGLCLSRWYPVQEIEPRPFLIPLVPIKPIPFSCVPGLYGSFISGLQKAYSVDLEKKVWLFPETHLICPNSLTSPSHHSRWLNFYGVICNMESL